MKQYLDLHARACAGAARARRTAPAPARCRYSATRCASTSRRASRWSPPSTSTCARWCTSCLWFLRGETNVAWLREHGVTIWDEWADERGELGPVYGKQWRAWATRRRPPRSTRSRRWSSSCAPIPIRAASSSAAWNVGELRADDLMPCHAFFQFYVARGAAVVPALPTQRRRVPRRAVQYRQLCAAHAHVRAAVRSRARGLHLDRRRLPPLPRTISSRPTCS